MTLAAEGMHPVLDGRTARYADLVDAFDTERRLLEDLRSVLLQQRDGLSKNDLNALDESVYSARRVLLTLQQARTRRRALLTMLGDDGATLTDLETVVGPAIPAAVLTSRDQLVEAANSLGGELRVNRRVIEGALYTGDRLLQAFAGNPDPVVYESDAEMHKARHAGSLLNTRA